MWFYTANADDLFWKDLHLLKELFISLNFCSTFASLRPSFSKCENDLKWLCAVLSVLTALKN